MGSAEVCSSLERLGILEKGKPGPLFERWRRALLALGDVETANRLERLWHTTTDEDLQRELLERLSSYNLVRLILAGVYHLDAHGTLRLTRIGKMAHFAATRNERLEKLLDASGEKPPDYTYSGHGKRLFHKVRSVFEKGYGSPNTSGTAPLEIAFKNTHKITFKNVVYREFLRLVADEIAKEAERLRRAEGTH